MTHPEQWDQLIRDLNAMYDRMVYVKQAEVHAIQAPTLIMAGDKDDTRPDHFVEIYKLLPNAQISDRRPALPRGSAERIFRQRYLRLRDGKQRRFRSQKARRQGMHRARWIRISRSRRVTRYKVRGMVFG